MQKLEALHLPIFCPLVNKRCHYIEDCIARELAPAKLCEDGSTLPEESGLALWCTYFNKIVAHIRGTGGNKDKYLSEVEKDTQPSNL